MSPGFSPESFSVASHHHTGGASLSSDGGGCHYGRGGLLITLTRYKAANIEHERCAAILLAQRCFSNVCGEPWSHYCVSLGNLACCKVVDEEQIAGTQ